VSGRQVGACCLLYELNGASAADGRRSSPELLVSARFNCNVGYYSKVLHSPFKGLSISSRSRFKAFSLPSP
jgi:hypothetical protein